MNTEIGNIKKILLVEDDSRDVELTLPRASQALLLANWTRAVEAGFTSILG